MTAFLNILLMLMSGFFFSGRLYELLFLVDEQTNFLLYKGIASSPFIIFIILLITICCGIIIFSGTKPKENVNVASAGSFAVLSGLLFAVGGLLQLVFSKGPFVSKLYFIFLIAGGAGLLLLGLGGLKGKKKEIPAVVLITLMCIGSCLDVIILNVSSIYDTAFLMKGLSAIVTFIFFLMLFKITYAPAKHTAMGLYIFGVLSFVITSTSYGAAIIGEISRASLSLPEMIQYFAFAVLGLYGLLVAFAALPTKEEKLAQNPREERVSSTKSQRQPVKNRAEKPSENIRTRPAIPTVISDEQAPRPAVKTVMEEGEKDFKTRDSFYPSPSKISAESKELQNFFTQSFDAVKAEREKGEPEASAYSSAETQIESETSEVEKTSELSVKTSAVILQEKAEQAKADINEKAQLQNEELKNILAQKRVAAQKKEEAAKQNKVSQPSKKLFTTKDVDKKKDKPMEAGEKVVYKKPSDK